LKIYEGHLAGCVEEYFQDKDIKISEDQAPHDLIDKGYRTVLDSKSRDESLVSSCPAQCSSY